MTACKEYPTKSREKCCSAIPKNSAIPKIKWQKWWFHLNSKKTSQFDCAAGHLFFISFSRFFPSCFCAQHQLYYPSVSVGIILRKKLMRLKLKIYWFVVHMWKCKWREFSWFAKAQIEYALQFSISNLMIIVHFFSLAF